MRLVSIYFGGGTPSLMAPDAVGELIALARRLWPPQAGLEVTLEANPTDAETGRLRAFADAGVNRLSLGVQALDDAELAFLKRNHAAAAARRAVETAAALFPQVSLDLIYALPGQNAAAWTARLREAAALGTHHISAYQLSVEPATPFGRMARRGTLPRPDPDLGADLYEATVETLVPLGFDAYEVSNFARGPAARSQPQPGLLAWRGLCRRRSRRPRPAGDGRSASGHGGRGGDRRLYRPGRRRRDRLGLVRPHDRGRGAGGARPDGPANP